MNSLSNESNRKSNLIAKLKYVIILIASLWVIKIIDIILTKVGDFSLNSFGISPGFSGLIGIIASPFLHGGFIHLISNTIPLFFLTITASVFYEKKAVKAILIIIILGGFLTWIAVEIQYLVFNQPENHIGASGLVFGLITFLIAGGLFRRNVKSILISFVILFLYGGTIIFGVMPIQPGVSWEGHLFGAVAGVFAAYLLREKLEVINGKSEHFIQKGA